MSASTWEINCEKMEDLELPNEIIELFIKDNSPIEVTNERLEEFLIQTKELDFSESEVIRRLAITLEKEEFKNGWKGLSQLYEFAHQKNTQDIFLLHSWAIATLAWIDPYQTSDDQQRIEIAQQGEDILLQALALDNHNSDIHHALGLLYYNHPARFDDLTKYISKALHHFLLAPDLQIAQLYAAHCYDDLQDWQNAYNSYLKVVAEKLLQESQYWQWRIIKMEEQIALCAAILGREAEAKTRLSDFMTKIELMSEDERLDLVMNFDEAVRAMEVLKDRGLIMRLKSLIQQENYVKRYEKELATFLDI